MSEARTINFKAAPEERQHLEELKGEIDRGIGFMNSGESDRAILVFKQLRSRIAANSPTFDILQHNLLTAYKQRIEQILEQGDITPINRYLPEVFELTLTGPLSDDAKFRGGFADAFRQL